MRRYTAVFRVRITQEHSAEIGKSLSRWIKNNRWERPGKFYRLLLQLGLEAYKKPTPPLPKRKIAVPTKQR